MCIFEWKINVKFPCSYHSSSIDCILFSPLSLHIKRKRTARKSISYRYIKCFKLTLPFNIQCRGFELFSSPRRTMKKLCILLRKCGSTSNVALLCCSKFLNVLFLSQACCGLADSFFLSCRGIWEKEGVWRRRKIAFGFLRMHQCTLGIFFWPERHFHSLLFVPQWPFFYLPYAPSVYPFFRHCKTKFRLCGIKFSWFQLVSWT